jgi:hypothetical protein
MGLQHSCQRKEIAAYYAADPLFAELVLRWRLSKCLLYVFIVCVYCMCLLYVFIVA